MIRILGPGLVAEGFTVTTEVLAVPRPDRARRRGAAVLGDAQQRTTTEAVCGSGLMTGANGRSSVGNAR
jgi:hypothetical protein